LKNSVIGMKSNEIDVSKIDLDKMKEKTAQTPSLLPYAHTAGGAVIKPEDVGKIKGRAVSAMREQTEMQMSQLYEQMQLLAEQAKKIQQRVEISERIYSVKMGFEPIIGKTYYLYRRENGEDFLSLIAPNEWGRGKKIEYVATVKLLADHTWDVMNEQEKNRGEF